MEMEGGEIRLYTGSRNECLYMNSSKTFFVMKLTFSKVKTSSVGNKIKQYDKYQNKQ